MTKKNEPATKEEQESILRFEQVASALNIYAALMGIDADQVLSEVLNRNGFKETGKPEDFTFTHPNIKDENGPAVVEATTGLSLLIDNDEALREFLDAERKASPLTDFLEDQAFGVNGPRNGNVH